MALVSLPNSIWWPYMRTTQMVVGSSATLNTSGNKVAMIGHLYIQGRAASKTLDTSGSSKLMFTASSTSVFDSGSSVLDVGIQGVDTTGPPARPNGTFSVQATVTTSAPTSPALTPANGLVTVTPTSGTVTLNHGDLIAFVVDFTTVGGSDSVVVIQNNIVGAEGRPCTNHFTGGAWGGGASNQGANCMITFSDGTLGWLDGSAFVGTITPITWNDTTPTPDERGIIFQVPFDCKIDALVGLIRQPSAATADADFEFALYSDPLNAGSITKIATSGTVDGAQYLPASIDGIVSFPISELTLARNTDYCVALRALHASGQIRSNSVEIGLDVVRAMWPGGANLRGVSRDGGSGAFGSESSINLWQFGVRISAIEDGAAGSGGSSGRTVGG